MDSGAMVQRFSTPPSHGGNTGSNPVSATIIPDNLRCHSRSDLLPLDPAIQIHFVDFESTPNRHVWKLSFAQHLSDRPHPCSEISCGILIKSRRGPEDIDCGGTTGFLNLR